MNDFNFSKNIFGEPFEFFNPQTADSYYLTEEDIVNHDIFLEKESFKIKEILNDEDLPF
jgi:hypothetical protein